MDPRSDEELEYLDASDEERFDVSKSELHYPGAAFIQLQEGLVTAQQGHQEADGPEGYNKANLSTAPIYG